MMTYMPLFNNISIYEMTETSKNLGIDLSNLLDGSIHPRKPYLTQSIINMIPGMDKSSTKTTPAVNTSLIFL